jgi:AraC family transcriptional regulator
MTKVPETTSAEALPSYVQGTPVSEGRGPAWKDVQFSIVALPGKVEAFTMPSVNEPFVAWTLSGEAEFEERENDGPWVANRIKKGSLFITGAGAPYEVRWRTVTAEPFQSAAVLLSVPLFEEAMTDVFGANAPYAKLRDMSAVEDDPLVSLLAQLRAEAARATASPLFVRSIGYAIAVHLARTYTVLSSEAKGETSALPGFKLRRITDWMTENMAEEFSLGRLAEQAGMSEFHFNRLFKRATGMPPSQYQIKLRLDAARRLLRETNKSVITIANDVGYSNPSHFAQLFRKETGLSPTDYRRQQ